MKKITLILIALITVACSDPEDKYIALECGYSSDGSGFLILDLDNGTSYGYRKNNLEFGEEHKIHEDGDHHYILTKPGSTASISLDRRTLEVSPRSGTFTKEKISCLKIDVPKEYLDYKKSMDEGGNQI